MLVLYKPCCPLHMRSRNINLDNENFIVLYMYVHVYCELNLVKHGAVNYNKEYTVNLFCVVASQGIQGQDDIHNRDICHYWGSECCGVE